MDFSFYTFFSESLQEVEQKDRVAFGHRGFPFYPAHYLASGAVEAARKQATEQGRQIRPDAQLLIYLLAHEFVAKPAIAVRAVPGPDIDHLLTADVQELVAEAEGEHEVSGHAVIDALSARWEALRATELDLWGP